MMKKALATLIPLCIIGFVGFWISTLVLGAPTFTDLGSTSFVDDNSTGGWNKSYTVKHEELTAEIKANQNLTLDISDVNAVVEPHDEDDIKVYVRNTSGRSVNVNLERDLNTYTSIKINTGVSFGFGFVNFNIPDFFGFFGGNITDRQVIIKVPTKTFASMKIAQGSGKSNISGITALDNSIDLGSGELNFERNESDYANSFNINMGSGKGTFTGIQTMNYHINIGSGSCKISNLTGNGTIDIGSGSVDISYDKSPAGKLDMGSGYAKLSIPTDSNTKFRFDIGSGAVEVCTNTQIQKYTKTGEYTMGEGESSFHIELGSGKIDIGQKGFTPGTVSSQMYSSPISELTITN